MIQHSNISFDLWSFYAKDISHIFFFDSYVYDMCSTVYAYKLQTVYKKAFICSNPVYMSVNSI